MNTPQARCHLLHPTGRLDRINPKWLAGTFKISSHHPRSGDISDVRVSAHVSVEDREEKLAAELLKRLRLVPCRRLAGLWSEKLERYLLAEVRIEDMVDVTISTTAELTEDPVPVVDEGTDVDAILFGHGEYHIVLGMVVLGLVTRFAKPGKPTLSCVVLDGSREAPAYTTGFDLMTSETEIIAQIEDLARKLSSELSSLNPDSAVIRVADVPPRPSRKSGPRHRLMIEGALAYMCRVHKVAEVTFRSGKDCGTALGVNKDMAMVLGHDIGSTYWEAAAAALSGLPATSSEAQSQ
jgi:hypothetical protein